MAPLLVIVMVIVLVIVHGTDAQLTVSVTVAPLLEPPPPIDAADMASVAWNGCANTDPLSIHAAQLDRRH